MVEIWWNPCIRTTTNALIRGDPVGRHGFEETRMAKCLEPTPGIAAYGLHHGVRFSAIPRLIPPVGERHQQATQTS